MTSQVDELKNKGNAALSSGKTEEAIDFYTQGIALDSSSQLLYSNRSAAYCKLGKYDEALKDAEEAIRLKPDWAKGHSRKGAALAFLKRNEDALMAYMEAFDHDPQNEQVKQAIRDLKSKMTGPGDGDALMNPFADLQIWEKLEADPKTREFLKDPDYKLIIETLHRSPKELGKFLKDSRVMTTLGVLLGVQLEVPSEETLGKMEEDAKKSSAKAEPKKDEKEQKKEKGGESQKKENDEALKEKELGNAAYKKKDFETALKHYGRAVELDPTNITYRNNQAAVYFEQKDYDQCIKTGLEAIEVGREHRADFKLVARAFARVGNAYQKKEDFSNALLYYNKSLSEHRDSEIVKKAQELEKAIKEKERLAYVDPDKSLEEKNIGNSFFQKGDFPSALKHYTEAIKRNPSDAKLYSNRAACYTKLAEFSMAIRDCDECLRLDPVFVKGHLRKAGCLLAMQDKSKALDAYQKALELDPNCQEAIDGCRSCRSHDQDDSVENVRRKAMQDPEVQQILADPAMQMILQQMQRDPKAVQEHLKNPDIARKLEKLIEVGVIGFR